MGAQGQTLQDADGRIQQDADGRMKLLNASGECPECCEELGGPCCADQECTIVLDGDGDWTFAVESSLVGSVSVGAAEWEGGGGDSPSFSGTYDIQASSAETLSPTSRCATSREHLYAVAENFTGQTVTDPSSVVDSVSLSHSVPYYDFSGSGDRAGCGEFSATMQANISLTSLSSFVGPGTLVGGTASTNPKIKMYLAILQEEYVQTVSGTTKTGQQPASCTLRVEIYADGSYAVWDGVYGSGNGTNSFSVSLNQSGDCVRGATLTFSITRTHTGTAPATTYSGTATMEWASGVGGCAGEGARGCADCGDDGGDSPGEPE